MGHEGWGNLDRGGTLGWLRIRNKPITNGVERVAEAKEKPDGG